MSKLVLSIIFFCLFLVSPAQAEESCEYQTNLVQQDLAGPLTEVSRITLMNVIKDCVLTILSSAGESLKGMGNCVLHPIECGEAAVEGIRNAYSFIH